MENTPFIVDLPFVNMVTFHGYVGLLEGIYLSVYFGHISRSTWTGIVKSCEFMLHDPLIDTQAIWHQHRLPIVTKKKHNHYFSRSNHNFWIEPPNAFGWIHTSKFPPPVTQSVPFLARSRTGQARTLRELLSAVGRQLETNQRCLTWGTAPAGHLHTCFIFINVIVS